MKLRLRVGVTGAKPIFAERSCPQAPSSLQYNYFVTVLGEVLGRSAGLADRSAGVTVATRRLERSYRLHRALPYYA